MRGWLEEATASSKGFVAVQSSILTDGSCTIGRRHHRPGIIWPTSHEEGHISWKGEGHGLKRSADVMEQGCDTGTRLTFFLSGKIYLAESPRSVKSCGFCLPRPRARDGSVPANACTHPRFKTRARTLTHFLCAWCDELNVYPLLLRLT